MQNSTVLVFARNGWDGLAEMGGISEEEAEIWGEGVPLFAVKNGDLT